MKNTLLKTFLLFGIGVGIGVIPLFAASSGLAETTKTERPSIVLTHTETLRATVQDVNRKKNEVVLKGPEGNTVTVKAGKDVKNLDHLEKGDEAVVRYYEGVAVAITKSGEAPVAVGGSLIVVPGEAALERVQVTAVVQDVDYQNRKIALKEPNGNVLRINVGENVANWNQIKKDDKVSVTYTRALAVSVEKQAK